jgi:hypothetical protein
VSTCKIWIRSGYLLFFQVLDPQIWVKHWAKCAQIWVDLWILHKLMSSDPDHPWVDSCSALVRGHLSVSLPFLSSPPLPLFICIFPTPLYHLQGPHRKPMTKSDDFPNVDSPKVDDFLLLSPLAPQQHRTSFGHIGTHPHDTTAPSTVTWMAINGRLGTGRLGIVNFSILSVDRPSQGSLERSLWISPD